jgi:hypothetical protein
LSLLFSNDSEDNDDFLLVLIFNATLVMTFFTTWLLFIWLLKLLGPERVGVLAGHPYEDTSRYTGAGRIVYAFSALMVLLFSVLFITEGLNNLQATTDTIDATNQDIISMHDQFLVITENLKNTGGDAESMRNELQEFLKQDICPLQPNSATSAGIRLVGQVTLDAIERLAGFIDEEIKDLNANLKVVKRATNEIDDTLGSTNFTGTAPTLVVSMVFLVTVSLIVALLLGWYEVYTEGYYFLVTWFVLPVFVLFVITAYVGAGAMVMLVQANSDWCLGNLQQSPEESIQAILERRGFQKSSMYYQVINFYSSQCREGNPWEFLEGFYSDLNVAKQNLMALSQTIIQISPAQLEIECGVEFGPALELLNKLVAHATILMDTGSRAMDMVKCKVVVPFYTRTVYTASCDLSIQGAKWCFATLMVIAFFGILLIMFRGAYYPIGYYYEDDGKRDYSTDSEFLDLSSDDDSFISESRVDDDVYDDRREDDCDGDEDHSIVAD